MANGLTTLNLDQKSVLELLLVCDEHNGINEVFKEVRCLMCIGNRIALVERTTLHHVREVSLEELYTWFISIIYVAFDSLLLDICKIKLHQTIEKLAIGSKSIYLASRNQMLKSHRNATKFRVKELRQNSLLISILASFQ
jgi:hypothetical protein